MNSAAITDAIQSRREALNAHPIYAAIGGIEDLRGFMEHHVYSVWDFMSLVKYLQGVVAPARHPWLPARDTAVRRFINELVLEEESDQGPPDAAGAQAYTSHFELYCSAMREIGADSGTALAFVGRLHHEDIDAALAQAPIPEPARSFMRATFGFIASGKPHVVAAALALGREHIIPDMFRALLERGGVGADAAPAFHYYLERHVHLDEGSHAPMSLRMLDELCGDDPRRYEEALAAARQAIDARIAFWDGVLEAISSRSAVAARARAQR